MKILTPLFTKSFFVFSLFLFLNTTVSGQNTTLVQEDKFEKLLNEKRKLNSSITDNNTYKIQIFNGASEASKKMLLQFKRENRDLDATIIFSTPTYKVWVGNFLTRIEGERFLNLIKKKYPNSILIKPKN